MHLPVIEFGLLHKAEENKLVVVIDFSLFKSIAMKKIIFVLTTMLASATIFATTPPEVNQKVLKAFSETFKQPKEVVCMNMKTFMKLTLSRVKLKRWSGTIVMEILQGPRVIISKVNYLLLLLPG
jgi:hypothetical protein